MEKHQWFYYIADKSGAVAKVNTDQFTRAMEMMGFRRCRYAEYLEARKRIRAQQVDISIEGKIPAEQVV